MRILRMTAAAPGVPVREQILAALAADPEFRPVFKTAPEVRLAVRGWFAFTTAVSIEWLRGEGDLGREQVRDLCARALLGVLA